MPASGSRGKLSHGNKASVTCSLLMLELPGRVDLRGYLGESVVVFKHIIVDGNIRQLNVHLPSDLISYFIC